MWVVGEFWARFCLVGISFVADFSSGIHRCTQRKIIWLNSWHKADELTVDRIPVRYKNYDLQMVVVILGLKLTSHLWSPSKYQAWGKLHSLNIKIKSSINQFSLTSQFLEQGITN